MRFIGIMLLILMAAASFPPGGDPLAQTAEPVRIGVSSMITPVDTVKYYQELIDYIGERIGRPVQMIHRRTYGEMDALLEKGDVKVAFICSAPYVKDRDAFGVELLVAPVVNGKPVYHSYIIVHKDSTVRSFAELRGKTFAFTDPGSNSGRLYPAYLLKGLGKTPERFFMGSQFSFSHNKSIELVAKKVVDGAAVDSLVYEYMVRKGSPYVKQTKVIKRSPPFGIPPVVVTKDIDPSMRRKIEQALLTMHETEKGKSIIAAMMIDGFVRIGDEAYETIRKMEKAVAGNVPVATKVERKEGTLLFGVIPLENPRMLYERFQPLLDHIAVKTGYACELVPGKTYADTIGALGRGELDFAFLGPLSYLEARKKYGARALVRPRGSDGSAVYRSVIITKGESSLRGVGDLKGKRLAFGARKSTAGNLMPRYLLAASGIHLNDLGGYAYFDYPGSVIKSVLRGDHDAGAIPASSAGKYRKKGIRVLGESEPIPTDPLVAGKNVPEHVVDAVRKALIGLDPQDPSQAPLLAKLDEDLKGGFTKASDEDYSLIRRKFNAVPMTCGRGCHPKGRL